MKPKEILRVSSWDEFLTLNHSYKWLIYFFGWLVVVSSVVLLVLEIVLYYFRDRTLEKKKHYLQFGYQRLPYFMGWACFMSLLAFGSVLLLFELLVFL